MRAAVFLLSAALFLSVCGAARALDVPLKYVAEEKDRLQAAEFALASASLAPFDMLAPNAPAGPRLEMSFGKECKASPGWKMDRSTKKATNLGGRDCCLSETGFSFTVDDPTSVTSHGDLYLLLEYFDKAPPEHTLIISYAAEAGGKPMAGCLLEPFPMQNTGTWKRQQFKLPRARLGEKHPKGYIMGISLRCEHRDAFPVPGGRQELDVYTSEALSMAKTGAPAVTKLPDHCTSQPVFAVAHFGERNALFLLDRQKPDDLALNHLYFDANQNGDFTDDPHQDAKAYASSTYWDTRFQNFDTTVQVSGKQLPFRFSLGASRILANLTPADPVTSRLTVSLAAQCCYRGEFDLEGKHYRVMLGDFSGNCRFGDPVTSRTQSSRWAAKTIDYYNGDRIFVTSRGGFCFDSGVYLGQWLSLGGKLYEVKVSDTESMLRLTPYAGKTARLKLPAETEELELVCADRKRLVSVVETRGKEIEVPEGEWVVGSYRLVRQDDAGALWYVFALGGSDAKPVKAEAGKSASLVYGEPFRPVVSVTERSAKQVRAGDKKAALEMMVLGAGDELVLRTWVLYGGPPNIEMSQDRTSQSKEPAYRIVKPDGEMVTQGTFEYG